MDKLPPACWAWPTVAQASELNNPAAAIWYNNTVMQEDCLYLNVWTPSLKGTREQFGDNKVSVSRRRPSLRHLILQNTFFESNFAYF